MISSKTDERVGVILSPYRLLSDHIIIESVHVTKENGLVNYKLTEINNDELRKHYLNLPVQAKNVLLTFDKSAISTAKDEIKRRFQNEKAGVAFDLYHKNAMIRRLNEQLESFRPFTGMVKWYHKLQTDKGHFRTGPCMFSSDKPQLQFEVTGDNQNLRLNTVINLNGDLYPLSGFSRYHFMLEKGNVYFLLSHKDYKTLEWLQMRDPEVYNNRPHEFALQLLSNLEKGSYKIKRNDLLAKNEIITVPHNRVMLSEISPSYLVLTPQWIYDGFLVEGPWKENHETILNGDVYLIKRNHEVESAFVKKLESLHENFYKQLNGYYYLSFADAQKKQWFLKAYHAMLDLNIEIVGMDMLQHFRYSPHQISTASAIRREEGSTVTIELKVYFGKESVSLAELQKILRAGQRSVLLDDGSLGILNDEWLAQYGVIIRHGRISDDDEIRVARWLAFSEQEANEETKVLKPILEEAWWQKWQRWQQDSDSVYPVPASIKATLRPYQKKGFEWIALLSEAGAGACLADDMGLGKTLQTICFLAHQLQLQPDSKNLIVCPSSILYNWKEELQKFAPDISSFVYHGASRDKAGLQINNCRIIITSYGTVRSDIEEISRTDFQVVVLDESHYIKNPDAQTTQAIGRLRAYTRIALSGTPVMNNTFDLFAQLNFILPGMFGNREFFNREYANAIDREHKQEKVIALRKLLSPFILRRTKENVAADLPPKTETVMWCSMKPPQKMLYDALKTQIRSSIFLNIKNEGLNKSKLSVLEGMLKLRQLCNSPLLLTSEEHGCTDSIKTNLLMNELKNDLKDHKVLVFSQFTMMLDLLAESCRQENIAFYYFNGQTPPAERFELVKRFQHEEDTTNVFLISLKAGNTGLNITAADYVFLFDPWWNTAIEQQAIGRTHRIGQDKAVFCYKMICKDTIEERIIEIQHRKKQLSDDLIFEDESFVKSLTEEDIEFLFS